MTRKALRIAAAGVAVAILAAFALYRALWHAPTVDTVAAVEGAIPVTVKGPGTVKARIPVTLSARVTAITEEKSAAQCVRTDQTMIAAYHSRRRSSGTRRSLD